MPLRFRSGLETAVAAQIRKVGIEVEYETTKLSFTKPETKHTYTPDFVLPNGIIVETKGRLDAEDRKKHILIRAQHPDLDIRFVFSNSQTRIRKGSPTTYAMWCDKHGFTYSDKLIPNDWFGEQRKDAIPYP